MNAQNVDVAIVGAGFTGAALAIDLARRLPRGARIALIGSPKATGRGLAYGTENPDHLLNVRASRLSILADDPDHFVRWLDRDGGNPELTADRYASRPAYGRYVLDTLHRTIAETRGRVQVDIAEGTAADVRKGDRGFVIRMASGEEFASPAVALCIGNGRSVFPLPVENISPAAHEHLIAEPFSDYRMSTIASDARVLLVGTGLTMIDQVLSLDRAGHFRRLTAVSRHGLVPAAHLSARSDLVSIELPEDADTLSGLLRAVRQAARAAGDWRAVIDGLRPIAPTIWQRLDPADRIRFIRHLEAFWSVHRHRMAPLVAARIADFRSANRLTLRAGRILAIRKAVSGVTVVLRGCRSSTVELLPFDWVINCTGAGKQISADPLVARLINRGWARPCPTGRGVDVDGESAVLGRSGAPERNLFALGPMTAGRFFEVTAVPEIREQIARVAAAIARQTESGAGPLSFSQSGRAR